MSRTIDVIKNIYKPYRFTKKGRVTILDTMDGTFVVKEKKDNIKKIFDYLKSRNFDNFPQLVDDSRSELDIYKYVEEIDMPIDQKAIDLVDTLGMLHNKTTYHKDVNEDTYKEIYENIKSNIEYLDDFYNNMYESLFLEEFMSPSSQLLMNNMSKIFSAIEFCRGEVDNWYDLIKDEKKQRVCLIHNNVELSHYLKNRNGYFISWDKAKIDTPVLDLVNFYKKDFFKLNFDSLLSRYFSKYDYSDSEKKLFFILISLPEKVEFSESEFDNVKLIRNNLDYIMKTENLIRPYYVVNKEE